MAGVSQNKVVFFQTHVHAIQIRLVESKEDLISIAKERTWLIDLAVNSREKKSLIDEYLRHVEDDCYEVDGDFLLLD